MKRNPIPAATTLGLQILLHLGPAALAATPDFWDEIPLSPSTTMPLRIQDDYWNGEFQRVNREVSGAKEAGMVFFGDSITWSWSLGPATGRDIWNEQYSRYQPINMGNSGDITPVMLYRAAHGNLDFPEGRQPKVAVLLCGINNFGVTQSDGGKEKWDLGINCPPVDIANGKRAIAQLFRRRLPNTRLIVMAILPVSNKDKWAKCREVNAINAVTGFDPNEVAYIDLQDKFLLPDGSINGNLFTDGTHLTTAGYQVWAKGIEPLVEQFMKAPPLAPEKVMLIGDSITEGRDSSGSYRRYLDGMLRGKGHRIDLVGGRSKHNDGRTEPDSYQYDVDHEGHWGKDSAWMAENMPGLLAGNVPDVAVIQLGTEEIISSKEAAGSLTDNIVRNIDRVVGALRAKNTKVKIVLSRAIPARGKEDVIGILNLKIFQYTQAHSTPQQPVMVAAPDEGFDVARDLADDGVLPNSSGAKKMAEAYAAAIHRLASEVER